MAAKRGDGMLYLHSQATKVRSYAWLKKASIFSNNTGNNYVMSLKYKGRMIYGNILKTVVQEVN